MYDEIPDDEFPSLPGELLGSKHGVLEPFDMVFYLENRLQEAITKEDEYIDFINDHQWTTVVYFAICSEIIKEYCKKLFVLELMADEYKETDDVNEQALVNELSHEQVANLLKHYGVIDGELLKDIEEIRITRNGLVHGPQRLKMEYSPEPKELHRKIETAAETIECLNSLRAKSLRGER